MFESPSADADDYAHAEYPYLVHEFCASVAENRTPDIDIDDATHYMAMGVAAHKSALKDGEIVAVTE